MMERLYYTDSFLREFDANVLSCQQHEKQFHIVLDRTAFYPTSGGQPHDIGKLAEVAVRDVIDREDEVIVHVTDCEVGLGQVRGAIDWARRFDHMQEHTGQHLLSAAFVELFQLPTVSFHLGNEISTIDVASASLSEEQVKATAALTNQIVFEDRQLEIQFATRENLAAAGVRKEVNREGPLRAVNIQGFDLQPCGGTHVSRTGQVGLVLVRKVEKQKQNWRVEFVCGGRAHRSSREDYKLLNEAAKLLSCGRGEVPAILGKALEERKEAQRECQVLLEELAGHEASEMLRVAKEKSAGSSRVLVRVFEEADAAYLRLVATRLVRESGVQVLLATKAGAHIVFAQSPGLSADMNAMLRDVVSASGGKGGGTRDFAQGKVANVALLEELMSHAAKSLGG